MEEQSQHTAPNLVLLTQGTEARERGREASRGKLRCFPLRDLLSSLFFNARISNYKFVNWQSINSNSLQQNHSVACDGGVVSYKAAAPAKIHLSLVNLFEEYQLLL